MAYRGSGGCEGSREELPYHTLQRATPQLRWRSAPAQTDAAVRCKKKKKGKKKKMTAGARGRALAAAPREAYCHSPQVKCLRRHMERGKLTTRGEISPEQRGRLARSRLLSSSSSPKQNSKKSSRSKRGGAIKINGVQRFDATTPTAMFAQRRRKRRWGKHKNSLYSLVTLSSCIINQRPGLSSLTFFYKCTLTLPSSAQVLACTAASLC